MPESVQWKTTGENRCCKHVNDHPTNHLPFAAEDEDNGLETIDGTEENEGGDGNNITVLNNEIDQVSDVSDNDGLYDGREQIQEDDESHTEAAETAELLQGNQFDEVVHGRIDPAATLRHED